VVKTACTSEPKVTRKRRVGGCGKNAAKVFPPHKAESSGEAINIFLMQEWKSGFILGRRELIGLKSGEGMRWRGGDHAVHIKVRALNLRGEVLSDCWYKGNQSIKKKDARKER